MSNLYFNLRIIIYFNVSLSLFSLQVPGLPLRKQQQQKPLRKSRIKLYKHTLYRIINSWVQFASIELATKSLFGAEEKKFQQNSKWCNKWELKVQKLYSYLLRRCSSVVLLAMGCYCCRCSSLCWCGGLHNIKEKKRQKRENFWCWCSAIFHVPTVVGWS